MKFDYLIDLPKLIEVAKQNPKIAKTKLIYKVRETFHINIKEARRIVENAIKDHYLFQIKAPQSVGRPKLEIIVSKRRCEKLQ